MLEKVIILILDGLGDRSIKDFGNKTPLEAADTKNLDKLAEKSECGLMHTLGRGMRPGSDVSHLAVFGYPPEDYYCGRGPIEVGGLGIKLEHGDVALRGNLATVDDDGIIKDRRAGRVLDVDPFTRLVDGMEINGVKFIVKPGTAHRAGIIMRGENLSSNIIDADPHKEGVPIKQVTPTDDSPEASRTAAVLNKFLDESHKILKESEPNIKRINAGEKEANYLLLRGAGQYNKVPTFRERYGLKVCCIAGGGLYKGIGAYLGMDVLKVPGATGLTETDIEAKFRTALEKLKSFDLAFVHVKGTDSLAHDGDFEGKKRFIEKIDDAAKIFDQLDENTLLVVTADHSTPCALKDHSADPVPIMFYGSNVRIDGVSAFNETQCGRGGLGFIEGKHLMPQVMNLLGKLPLIGA
ncbi:MAG: 2,3-bisphosphoglycerate-independent phosphoglycerate mutase [bacterium]|nr:2,3-bisphosphoglycerate-independent phosphoglycerate mutase [bacterium]